MFRKAITQIYRNIFQRQQLSVIDQLSSIDKGSVSVYQKRKLIEILQYSKNKIPYYQKILADIDIHEEMTYEEFSKIPFLTKKEITDHLDSLKALHYQNLKDVFRNTSGGSTGSPVTFYQTKQQNRRGIANFFYALLLNGVDINKFSVDLWGAERDMYKGSPRTNLKLYLQNKALLNSYVLDEGTINNYLDFLNEKKPHFIKAYVHSIYDIAKYINKNNIRLRFTPIIHTSAGPLYEEMRKEIKQAFNNAHVYSFYGSREVSSIAVESLRFPAGMEVLYDNVFVEIVNEQGRPVKNGEEGEIVVTTLNNDYMPLIRFRIGDRAIKYDHADSFGTRYMSNVLGRTLGVIYRKDGKKVDGHFITTLFFNIEGIRHFQVFQPDIEQVLVRVVKDENFSEMSLSNTITRLQEALPGTIISVEYLEKIELNSTGKIMYVYSLVEI